MAYVSPSNKSTGDLITSAEWNQSIVANSQASVPDIFTTAGDTVYGTAADTATRLAAGSAYQSYRMNSAGTAPEWGDGNLINELTASTSASLVFSSLSSSFRTYEFVIKDLVPATDNVSLQAELSIDNGSNYLGTNNIYSLARPISSAASYAGSASNSAAVLILSTAAGSAAGESSSGIFKILNHAGSKRKHCSWHICTQDQAGNDFANAIGVGGNHTTSAVTAIRFTFSSGNIASGTIALYGRR